MAVELGDEGEAGAEFGLQLGEELVAAFFVGGFLFAAVFTPLVYFGVLAYVRRHRARVAAKHREEKTNG